MDLLEMEQGINGRWWFGPNLELPMNRRTYWNGTTGYFLLVLALAGCSDYAVTGKGPGPDKGVVSKTQNHPETKMGPGSRRYLAA
jgi:hypothetical protein